MFDLTDDQKNFVEWFHSQQSRLLKLTGYAGTGKTTVLNHLGWDGTIYFATPTNQAKNILAGKVKSKKIYTVSSLLGHGPVVEKGKVVFKKMKPCKIKSIDEPLLVIDESSMLTPDILEEIIGTNASKILFCGDPNQIPPIDYNISPIYSSDYEYIPTFKLTEIVRQAKGSPIIELSQSILKKEDDFSIKGIKEIKLNKNDVSEWYQGDGIRVAVCPTHNVKNFCNIIGRRVNNGGVDPDEPYIRGEQFFLESPIFGGPKNGDIVQITSVPEYVTYKDFDLIMFEVNDRYMIKTPFDITVEKKVKEYLKQLEYRYSMSYEKDEKDEINDEVEEVSNTIIFGNTGYAMTAHKSQGTTLEHVMIATQGLEYFGNTFWNMIYTMVTRASKSVTIAYPV